MHKAEQANVGQTPTTSELIEAIKLLQTPGAQNLITNTDAVLGKLYSQLLERFGVELKAASAVPDFEPATGLSREQSTLPV